MPISLPKFLNIHLAGFAQRYGVTISAIGYVFKKLTGNGLKPQLSQSDRKAIVAELQSGKTTFAELSIKYGVHCATIGRVYKTETGRPWKPKIPLTVKKEIVADLLAGKVARMEAAANYGVSKDTVERSFKRQVGKPINVYKKMLKTALKNSHYRAWHTVEKKMYPVLGLDWFNQKVLINTNEAPAWHPMDLLIRGVSTVGAKSWNRMFSALVEPIGQALSHQVKKQFRVKNLYEKVVIPAITSQNGES